MSLESIDLRGTTDASGDATITAPRPVLGFLYAVRWIDGDLADGVDATITVTAATADGGAATTLLTLTDANDDAWYYVRELEDDNAGAALTTYTYPFINGTVQNVIASGGATKTGGAIVYYFTDL
jgi:hypothetical protein